MFSLGESDEYDFFEKFVSVFQLHLSVFTCSYK
jgi:hypothetical protein